MNRKAFILAFSFILFLLSPTLMSQEKKSPKDLDPKHRRWLEEEVVYIITSIEKDVFLQLDSERGRNLFIEAFWRHRDPNLTTPENEFKTEHYRRINYTNQWFGRDAPGPGWRSEMGRIYIILGESPSIERFENLSEVWPIVIWFYSAKPEMGLPSAFNVVFFKRDEAGDYQLYSPVRFGPQSLLIHYNGDPSDYRSAYYQLQDVEPILAEVSMTLLPGEAAFTMSPSIASEVLIHSKIPAAPGHQVKDAYAEKLLAYKDIVEVEYSANYIESDAYFRVLKDKSGIYFVHYLIEPSRLTFEQYGNRFLTNLEVNGNISDLEGNTIFQFERTIPIEFNQEQMNSIKAKLFSFQDMFPLIEGSYKLSLLLKNRVSKEFASAEKDIFIPKSSDSLQMSSLILANRLVTNSAYVGKSKPFLFSDMQLIPSPRNDFIQQDHLYLFFQIHGLTADLEENGILEYAIITGDKKVQSIRKNIKDYAQTPNFFEEFSLSDLTAAFYKIRASLLNKDNREILFEEANFYITHAPYLSRPWVLSLPVSSSEDPVYLNTLGSQYLKKKDFATARRLLEEAYRKNTASAKFALDFCRSLIVLKDFQKVKEIALPFLGRPEKHEFYAIMGQSSHALGQWEEAISHYKDYLTYYGTNIQILNSIGECYYQLGNREEALLAWERSLELNPKQEGLKKRVKSLKEKK